MIKSFRCKETARLFDDTAVRRFKAIERVARRKLLILHRSKELTINGEFVFAGKMEM